MFSLDQGMVLRSVFVFIAGLLVASGHLSASNSDLFVNDATTLGGLVLSVIGAVYLCEHQFMKVKADLTKPASTTIPVTPQTTESIQSQSDSSASVPQAASQTV